MADRLFPSGRLCASLCTGRGEFARSFCTPLCTPLWVVHAMHAILAYRTMISMILRQKLIPTRNFSLIVKSWNFHCSQTIGPLCCFWYISPLGLKTAQRDPKRAENFPGVLDRSIFVFSMEKNWMVCRDIRTKVGGAGRFCASEHVSHFWDTSTSCVPCVPLLPFWDTTLLLSREQ